jgi:ketosteroid isomerase-like protein
LSYADRCEILSGMTPTETMRSYFDNWNARDFDAFQSLLADDVTFRGPLGSADGPQECRAGVEGMSRGLNARAEVVSMLSDGPEVITWFELHTNAAPPVAVANYSRVLDGKVVAIRAAFDPRPLLG